MSLPWPDGVSHSFTSGPHGEFSGQPCLPTDLCASQVPLENCSGLDFGAGGGDWLVYPIAAGVMLYKGALDGGFGAGVVVAHGDIDVVYAHMDATSLSAAPAPGEAVTRATALGTTWCTGLLDAQGRPDCSATSGNHHLHLELRTGLQAICGRAR